MEEIKFRAWNPTTKTMIYPIKGDLLRANEKSELEYWFGATKCIVMLWTGLLDKQGKEIYEGDIVKVRGQYTDFENFVVTHYFGGAWGLENGEEYLHDLVGTSALRYDSETGKPIYTEVEVIGNIRENPELMEVSNE